MSGNKGVLYVAVPSEQSRTLNVVPHITDLINKQTRYKTDFLRFAQKLLNDVSEYSLAEKKKAGDKNISFNEIHELVMAGLSLAYSNDVELVDLVNKLKSINQISDLTHE